METKVIESKQFSLNSRDFIRGFKSSLIAALLPLIPQIYESWKTSGSLIIDWHQIAVVSIGALVSYLGLNFFSKGKVITIPSVAGSREVSNTASLIKRVV